MPEARTAVTQDLNKIFGLQRSYLVYREGAMDQSGHFCYNQHQSKLDKASAMSIVIVSVMTNLFLLPLSAMMSNAMQVTIQTVCIRCSPIPVTV